MTNKIYFSDNLDILKKMDSESVNLIYIDPPFNTGQSQKRIHITTIRDVDGDRKGFAGKNYKTMKVGSKQFSDTFDDFMEFLEPRLIEAHRILAENGTMYLHIDYREVHYIKILMDKIFGRASFLNEIIWAYDYGARAKTRWPAKHDNILMYVKNPKNYTFNVEDIDRIPYMAPGLVGPEKAKRGKLPTDTWWHTIVGTNSKEKTGYPTQKPIGILKRIICASSNPGEIVFDFFAGSGTTAAAAITLDRQFILVDQNPESIEVMKTRFQDEDEIQWIETESCTNQQ